MIFLERNNMSTTKFSYLPFRVVLIKNCRRVVLMQPFNIILFSIELEVLLFDKGHLGAVMVNVLDPSIRMTTATAPWLSKHLTLAIK